MQTVKHMGFAMGLVALMLTVSAIAQIPQQISYQGQLTDSSGAPLDTIVTLNFVIYADSAGTQNLWQEVHPSVTVTNGLFDILLGSITPIGVNVFDGNKRWL